tara:strand:- start:3091 stop:3714 length:624 start_codon:yes stop_codon:yes gene_type:complete
MKDSILGIPFYRFYYPHDIKEVEEACKRLNYRHNDCNWIWDGVQLDGLAGSNLHRLPEFEILFNWIDECLREVADDIGMPNNLKINAAWTNLNKKGDYFYDHTHANCFVSSNFYVNGSPDVHTIWHLPNPWFNQTNIWPWGQWTEEKFFLTHKEPTEPGKYIVFPPMIRHRAEVNTSDEDRITIAANAFPDGFINASGVSHLHVKVL